MHLMYPFRTIQQMGTKLRRKAMLLALVRYIYRETLKVDERLGSQIDRDLIAGLKEIARNYKARGGTYSASW